jgi:hypothetical protein
MLSYIVFSLFFAKAFRVWFAVAFACFDDFLSCASTAWWWASAWFAACILNEKKIYIFMVKLETKTIQIHWLSEINNTWRFARFAAAWASTFAFAAWWWAWFVCTWLGWAAWWAWFLDSLATAWWAWWTFFCAFLDWSLSWWAFAWWWFVCCWATTLSTWATRGATWWAGTLSTCLAGFVWMVMVVFLCCTWWTAWTTTWAWWAWRTLSWMVFHCFCFCFWVFFPAWSLTAVWYCNLWTFLCTTLNSVLCFANSFACGLETVLFLCCCCCWGCCCWGCWWRGRTFFIYKPTHIRTVLLNFPKSHEI